MRNDREALEAAVKCVGAIPPDKLKIMRIKNTLHLSEVEVSEAYQDQIMAREAMISALL